MTKTVLDKGFVSLVDSMGSDLSVVNSARVSFGKKKEITCKIKKVKKKVIRDTSMLLDSSRQEAELKAQLDKCAIEE